MFTPIPRGCRRAAVPMPPGGVRESLYPAVQPPAAPEEPRRPSGKSQEPTLPLYHLRQGVRHRVQPKDPHHQGTVLQALLFLLTSEKYFKIYIEFRRQDGRAKLSPHMRLSV